MFADRTLRQRVVGNALSCAQFIAKACRRLAPRAGLTEDAGRESERLLKGVGLRPARFSDMSLEDKWRQELAILAAEQSERN